MPTNSPIHPHRVFRPGPIARVAQLVRRGSFAAALGMSSWSSAAQSIAGDAPELMAPVAALSASVGAVSAAPVQHSLPVPPATRIVPGLDEPLVATGPVTDAESRDLDMALAAYRAIPVRMSGRGDFYDYAGPLLDYVSRHPGSHWNASLDLDIGRGYYRAGYYSLTFERFQQAWALSRDAETMEARRMADRAMGELAEMHARLGHKTELEAFFGEVSHRPVSSAATFMMDGAHVGLETFLTNPGIAYLCGPAALRNVLLALGATPRQIKVAADARSGEHGFSLTQLAELARRSGLRYRLIHRDPGQPVPVPAILHWSVHHYAALLEQRDADRFRIADPTFGAAGSVVTTHAITAEGSGYFLVPEQVVRAHPSSGWRIVAADSAEATAIYGMGSTINALPGCTTCKDASTPQGGQIGSSGGMTVADATLPKASLRLRDTPVGYDPQMGPSMKVTLTYNARDGDQPGMFGFSNVGPLWTHNWQSYVQDDPNNAGSNVKRVVAGGGGYDYDVLAQLNSGQGAYNSATGAFAPEAYDNSTLMRVPATGAVSRYVRLYPDGSQEIYGRSNGATAAPRLMFLTARIDPAGNTTVVNYDSSLRIATIVDAMGRTTRFDYGIANAPLLITQITDPFGRFTKLIYDAKLRLQSITDPIGITSSFAYGSASEPNFVTALTTPYGTSIFSDKLNPNDPGNGTVTYSLTMTDPLGNVQMVYLNQNASVTHMPSSENPVPAGIGTTDNGNLNYRNVFYWGAHAAGNGGVTTDGLGNPTAENWSNPIAYHFFHQCCTINYISNQLASVKRPLEIYRTWYKNNPFDPGGGIYSGLTMDQTYVGRVLDSSGTTQYSTTAYNALGRPTVHIDEAGRSSHFTYGADNIDLLQVLQKTSPSGYSVIASFANYTPQHLPQIYKGADGQVWNFTYTAAGQIRTATDPKAEVTTLNYDGVGRLSSAQNANAKTAFSLTYDGADRVLTRTDSEGYTLTYSYDNLDRVTQVLYPDRSTDRFDYNFQSGSLAGTPSLELRRRVDRLGRVTTMDYDADRRMIALTEPVAAGTTRTTRYSYYEDGTLKELQDGKGNVTHWDIDIESRPVAKTYAYGTASATTETYAYEAATSRLHSLTDALGQVKIFGYAPDNRLVSETYSRAINRTHRVSFLWDPYFPRVARMSDGLGITNFSYVPIGSPGALKLALSDGPFANDTIALGYDSLGRVVSRAVDGGSESFQHDAIARLGTHTSPLGTFTFGYLGQTSQMTSRSVAAKSGTISTSWGYDSNVNDRRLVAINNSGVARSYRFGFTNGNATNPYDILSITDTAAAGHPFASQSHAYRYDQLDRLLSATATVTGDFGFGYDNADNITAFTTPGGTSTASYTPANTIASFGSNSYVYDANGNLLSDGEQRSYQWDAENRLIEIDYLGTANKSEFVYDGLGRMTVDSETKNGAVTQKRYLWCGSKICQSRDAADTVLRRDFDEGEFNVATAQPLIYMPDQLGSARDVLNAATGALAAAFDFAPNGALVKSSGKTAIDFRFAGLFSHAASGLNIGTFRFLDGKTGRWLNRDPIRESGGINLYSYDYGNPIGNIDTDGTSALTIRWGLQGARVGAALGSEVPVVGTIAEGIAGFALGVAAGYIFENVLRGLLNSAHCADKEKDGGADDNEENSADKATEPGDVLTPNGQPVGDKVGGAGRGVRTVTPGQLDGIIDGLKGLGSKPGSNGNYPGDWHDLPNNQGGFGIRNSRGSGRTVDVNIPEVPDVTKIHQKP